MFAEQYDRIIREPQDAPDELNIGGFSGQLRDGNYDYALYDISLEDGGVIEVMFYREAFGEVTFSPPGTEEVNACSLRDMPSIFGEIAGAGKNKDSAPVGDTPDSKKADAEVASSEKAPSQDPFVRTIEQNKHDPKALEEVVLQHNLRLMAKYGIPVKR